MERLGSKDLPQPTQLLESPTRADLELALEDLNALYDGPDELFVLVTDEELLRMQAHGKFDKKHNQWWLQTYNPTLTDSGCVIAFLFSSNSDHYLDQSALDFANRKVFIRRGSQSPTENQ